MNAIHTAESRALNAHLARNDRFAELDEMSYADLQSLADDLSEGSQWSLLDDVKAELAKRLSDAEEALAKLFVEQATWGGEIPMPEGGGVEQWPTTRYLIEAIGESGWGSMVADILIGYGNRDALIAGIANEYGEQQATDLLRAGWTQ